MNYSRLSIWLCLCRPRGQLFPYVCMYAQSVTSIYLREKCFALARQLCLFPASQTVLPSILPFLPKPRATSCSREDSLSRPWGGPGGDQVQGQETEAWMEKRILSHAATFRSLLACFGSLWLLDLNPESPANGEQPPEDPHIPPMCKRSGPLATLGSDKTSTLTLFL